MRLHQLVKYISHDYLLLVAGGRKQEDVNGIISRTKENGGSHFLNAQQHKSSALLIVEPGSIPKVLDTTLHHSDPK